MQKSSNVAAPTRMRRFPAKLEFKKKPTPKVVELNCIRSVNLNIFSKRELGNVEKYKGSVRVEIRKLKRGVSVKKKKLKSSCFSLVFHIFLTGGAQTHSDEKVQTTEEAWALHAGNK